MIEGYVYYGLDPFENQVYRAEKAIERYATDENREWLTRLFNILKEKKHARVKLKYAGPNLDGKINGHKLRLNGGFQDVSRLAHTNWFASCFDVISSINDYDYKYMPNEIKKLVFKYY